jgi:hypothetical protein
MNPAMRSMRKWHADRLERGEDQSGVPLMTEAAIKGVLPAACCKHRIEHTTTALRATAESRSFWWFYAFRRHLPSRKTAAACLRHDGYESPELNESLYLHFRGFMRIENLEPYTSVKALFLESNNLRRIEGVDDLVSLRALFLQQVRPLWHSKVQVQLDWLPKLLN